jgi:predicted phosphoribosyltransferase
MPFRNRSEAGRRLAVALAGYKEQEPTILALPRGGVAVAAEVAAALDAPLDLILVRKVGVPFQPELAMGAVADGGGSIIVRNEDVIKHAGIDEAEFNSLLKNPRHGESVVIQFSVTNRRRLACGADL